MIKARFVLLAMAFVLSSGCAWKYNVQVMRPAEVNMVSYKKVAIMAFEGDKGSEVADLLTQKLFESGRFEIIDRSNIDSIIREQQLSMSVLYSAEGASKIGQLARADALIFGNAKSAYTEKIEQEPWQDSVGNHINYTRVGKVVAHVTIKVTDIASSRIVATKMMTATRTAESETITDNPAPAPIDPEPLYEQCLQEVTSKFMKVIAPYADVVQVELQKFKFYEADVQRARQFVERGNWPEAADIFKQIKERAENDPLVNKDNEQIAMAYYNYGVSLQYSGNYEEAMKHLEIAHRMVPGEGLYADQISRCRNDKKNAQKLVEQQAAPQE